VNAGLLALCGGHRRERSGYSEWERAGGAAGAAAPEARAPAARPTMSYAFWRPSRCHLQGSFWRLLEPPLAVLHGPRRAEFLIGSCCFALC